MIERDLIKSLTDKSFQLTRSWFSDLFAKKLKDAGLPEKPGLVSALVDHVFSGADGEFEWTDNNEVPDASIQLSLVIEPEDLAEFEQVQGAFHASFPEIIEKATRGTAAATFKEIRSRWPIDQSFVLAAKEEFLERLEHRWGEAFSLLRMLEACSRDLGAYAFAKYRRSRAKRSQISRDVLIRLHLRACQVAAETITLMESGYADGAMARWRTLHEITTVALVILDHGDAISERYLAHEAVESMKAARAYMEHLPAGERPISQSQLRKTERAYDEAIAKYGRDFKREYGWAAHHLRMANPTFDKLEAAAGRAALRSHYKMASYNVHAGTKGISFKLGTLNTPHFIGGASNAGFEEPGSATAYALTQINIVLLGQRWTLEEQVMMRTMTLIRDAACKAFAKAGRCLRRDDAKLNRDRARRRKARSRG